jgi:hypothetical protein
MGRADTFQGPFLPEEEENAMNVSESEKQDGKAAAGVKALTRALAEPFDPSEVKWKPQTVSGNRALAVAFVDARVIQDRLDEVLGPENWQDDYEFLPDGSVVCRLRLRLGEEWVTKVDVGGPSEQQDSGDRVKAAVSDSLKRAAVKFGCGRYLYRLPAQWVDYDPQRRQFVRTPTLPSFALPRKLREKTAEKKEAEGAVSEPAGKSPAAAPARPAERSAPGESAGLTPVAKKGKAAAKAAASHALPTNGEELQRRLQDYDTKLAAQGLCPRGALVKHVAEAGAKAGHDKDLTKWSGAAITLAVEETKAFEGKLRQQQGKKKEVA